MSSKDIIIQYISACAAPRKYHYIHSSQTVDLAKFSDLNLEYKQVLIRYEKFIIHIQITYTFGKVHSFLCTQVPPHPRIFSVWCLQGTKLIDDHDIISLARKLVHFFVEK